MRTTIFALAIVLANPALAHAATLSAGAQAILKVHNRERAVVGTPPLQWDRKLADHAADWAEHLVRSGKLEHSANNARPGEGENLLMGTQGGYTPTEMVENWAGEKRYFKYGAFPNITKSGNWQVVGHYSQMIWRNTTKIGCALAKTGKWDILVCRYSPAGNFVGERPY
jgi:hypothetical protein